MKFFWPIIVLLLAIAFAVVFLLPKQDRYDWHPSLGIKLVSASAVGLIVLCAWAICFRRQIEQLQVSIIAWFALVAMFAAALGFAYVQSAH
jgi:hypothetical protein